MKRNFVFLLFLASFISFEIQSIPTRFATSYRPYPGIEIQDNYYTDISGKVYLGIIAAALALKVGYDVSWHNDYATKAHDAFNRFVNHTRLHDISSLKDEELYSFFNEAINYDFCLTYESWLRNSYASWLKPWNWTNSQKTAYEKMEILAMISLYGSLIVLDQQAVEQKLVDHARRHCSAVCEYPLVYYGNQIDRHLAALKKGFSVKTEAIQRMLLELEQELYKLKYILRGNKSYIEECHTLRTHQLLEEAARNR